MGIIFTCDPIVSVIRGSYYLWESCSLSVISCISAVHLGPVRDYRGTSQKAAGNRAYLSKKRNKLVIQTSCFCRAKSIFMINYISLFWRECVPTGINEADTSSVNPEFERLTLVPRTLASEFNLCCTTVEPNCNQVQHDIGKATKLPL